MKRVDATPLGGGSGSGGMRAILDPLEDRLLRAALVLTELAQKADGFNAERLCGKAEGVQLALSYLREEQRA